jgi:DNA-binding Lrp family transcriptional regulator
MADDALQLSEIDRHLLDDFQHGLPLDPRPFARIGEAMGVAEEVVIAGLGRLRESGAVSRVGPVFSPNRLGASTLAALAVPRQELEAVATIINGYVEVNHNYEREHHYNLWFVVTAADRRRIDSVLGDIAQRTGLEPLDLPLLEDYFIDLGFRLWT